MTSASKTISGTARDSQSEQQHKYNKRLKDMLQIDERGDRVTTKTTNLLSTTQPVRGQLTGFSSYFLGQRGQPDEGHLK